ncbi:hypothetical protein GGX14DRAFT_613758 [Mycena pura]|uniref:Uncharacterized protein n=1 Tax=Mycena pura TaxID=153505 RepID=A0AAD6YTA5_9AGAR|nr:hypothetical protein GGX14DRAFT_613758 [Mycena pura]
MLGTMKSSLKAISRTSRKLSSVFRRRPSFVCWGVLGVGSGNMQAANVGWMVSDYVWWVFLIHNSPSFDEARSCFHVLRSLRAFYPDGHGIHGEAACRRLRFPLHPSLMNPLHPPYSASEFKVAALAGLFQTAMAMKVGETLLLLLIGHGSCDHNDTFHLWVTTEFGLVGEASFTKEELEAAVYHCKARVVVISNACQSGLLRSERWTLMCAAHPEDKSDSLAQSSSGYVRGSMFTSAVTAQMAADFGVHLPRPRADKRSITKLDLCLTESNLVPLPPSPPPHSLLPRTMIEMKHPVKRGIRALVDAANSYQQYMLYEAATAFGVYSSPSADGLAWHDVSPIPFTKALTTSISLYSDDTGGIIDLFGTLRLQGGSSAPRPASQLPDHLRELAEAYSMFAQAPHGPEARDIRRCVEYLQHTRSPSVNPSPFQGQGSEERDFYKMLRCRNVQSIAVQFIARGLGWWEGEVTPFVLRPFGDYRAVKSEMRELGMSTFLIIQQLYCSCSWLSKVEEAPPISWLISKWLGAGSPIVSKEIWDTTVAEAAATAAVHVHPNYSSIL